MIRLASILAVVALVFASPAFGREERHRVSVPASRLDLAIQTLGRQTGTSIGFRDRRIAHLRVRTVRGTMTASEALASMLKDSGAIPRRVASGSFLIEPAPRPSPTKPRRREGHAASTLPPPPPVEIIVTATKRDIPIASYPGMVHVVEGDRISVANGRQGTDALGTTTTSVVSTHLGPGRNKLFIRGIADSSFLGPTQATVGQYWGNSRITYASPDPSLKLYDVGRIEVLEGPQGTLYGAGSLGGIVRVVPQGPRLDRVEGTAWTGIEAVSHGQAGYDGGVVANLPLIKDRLGLRAVAFGSVESGYIDDIGRGLNDVNDVNSFGGRVALRFDATDSLSFSTSVVGQRIDGADSQYSESSLGGLERSSTMALPFRNDFLLADIVAHKSWNELELTVSAAYAGQKVSEQFEGLALTDPGDTLIGPSLDASQTSYRQSTRGNMITGEIRLARNLPGGTGWLLAASLLHNDAKVQRETSLGGTSLDLTGVKNSIDEITVYGEGSVTVTGGLKATVGGRLTSSRLSGQALTPVNPEIVLALDPGASQSRTETELLPSAALSYETGQVTLFARYQEGFRPGGIAVRREFVQRFSNDTVSSAEAGARYRGSNLKLEASVSRADWRNIQADVIDGFGFPATTNIGDGRVFSLGLSGRWRPLPSFELEGAVYVNDSKVTQPVELVFANQNGEVDRHSTDRLPNIADFMAHAGFSWWGSISKGYELELSGHARYVGKSVLGVGPLLGREQGNYIDTGIEAQLVRGNLRYSLSLTNLLDVTGNRFALGSPFQLREADQIVPLKPRTIRMGIQISY